MKYPEWEYSYLAKGWANFHLEYYEKAFKDLDKAIKINSKFADAYYGRAEAHRFNYSYDKAINDYNKFEKLNPNGTEHLFGRAYSFKETGKWQKAKEDYEKLLKYLRTSSIYNNLANIYDQYDNNYRKAIEYYSKAIEFTNENNQESLGMYYNNRGKARIRINDRVGAKADFLKAAEYGNTDAQNNLYNYGLLR